MRIAVMVLALIGSLVSGLLGMKWISDAAEHKELLQQAEKLGIAPQAIAQAKSLVTAGWMLLLAGVAASAISIVFFLKKVDHKIAGGVLLACALLPAVFAAKTLIFTFFFLIAGGLAFAAKTPVIHPAMKKDYVSA